MNKIQPLFFDPFKVLNSYNESKYYKEYFLFFAVAVAGKNAKMMTPKVNNFIGSIISDNKKSLFTTIEKKYIDMGKINDIEIKLRLFKLGKYHILINFIKDFIKYNINIETCSIEQLEELTGVGKKTSRFFALYCRKDLNKHIAVLDTHVLKYLSKNGIKNVPKTTPAGKKYDLLEKEYLKLFNLSDFKDKRDFDFHIWINKGII